MEATLSRLGRYAPSNVRMDVPTTALIPTEDEGVFGGGPMENMSFVTLPQGFVNYAKRAFQRYRAPPYHRSVFEFYYQDETLFYRRVKRILNRFIGIMKEALEASRYRRASEFFTRSRRDDTMNRFIGQSSTRKRKWEPALAPVDRFLEGTSMAAGGTGPNVWTKYRDAVVQNLSY